MEKGTGVIGVMIMVEGMTEVMTMIEGITADMIVATMIRGMNEIAIVIVTIGTTNPL
ncbi:hypothetical protein [Pseudomonas sp. GL-B-19]|uniref:hypothetical protein n=1 Tax=Pseudomonas sp. GL-B-19 TaxID=2832393 RepID=UPI001CC17698|nr:hypothetical protein [Pseudomonas sp. GL-B-19]